MVAKKNEAAAKENISRLVEAQIQGSKNDLRRLDRRLEETSNLLTTVRDDLQKREKEVVDLSIRTTSLPSIQEEVQQIKSWMDHQSASQDNTVDQLRKRQSDLEKERQNYTKLAQKLQAIDDLINRHETRLHAIEGAARNMEGEAAKLHKVQTEIEHDLEGARSRSDRGLEATTRIENEQTKFLPELEALSKRADQISDEVHLVTEIAHRVEDRLGKVELEIPMLKGIQEFQDRSRAEREKFSERITKVESSMEEAARQAQDLRDLFSEFRQQWQGQASGIFSMVDEVKDNRQQIEEYIKRFSILMQRQRQRQVSAIGQEIKEIKGMKQGKDDDSAR